MRLWVRIILIIIVNFCVLVGCTNSSNDYKEFTNNFNKSYYSVAEHIDIKDPYKSIENLQSDDNKKLITEMQETIINIKGKVPKSKEKLYEQQKKQADGLVFLKDIYSNWDGLTKDDKRRINVELLWAYHLYEEYKSNN